MAERRCVVSKSYDEMSRGELVAEVDRLLAAMPEGKWVHDRWQNEHGWWSTLIQERTSGPNADRVMGLLNTVTANQEKGGDLIEFMVRARALLPLLAKIVEQPPSDDAKMQGAK